MVSNASDDFPEPLTPVTIISLPTGSVTSMFFRLCVRAPRTTRSAASWDMLGVRPTATISAGCVNHHRSAASYTRQRPTSAILLGLRERDPCGRGEKTDRNRRIAADDEQVRD